MADDNGPQVTHGSESFFIEGEGLLSSAVGGRSGEEPDPVDRAGGPRATAARTLAAAKAPPFRFSRIGPQGVQLSAPAVSKLAKAMTAAGSTNGTIPSGYTYLGQFVDHDLTMDRTQVMLGTDVSPTDLLQGRSPRLDLDSLYGAGPTNPGSAAFYEADGHHLKTGTTIAAEGVGPQVGHDLPRVGKGPGPVAKRKALIPDPRNDENLIVAQTHCAFIAFHNLVVDTLPKSVPPQQRFRRSRKRVSLHYQWLLRHDYLPRIVDPAIVNQVFRSGRKIVEPGAPPTSVPTMPIEFSVAAFRLGHSMVRPSYNWNSHFPGNAGGLDYMFIFSALGGDLGGDRRLISSWIADWRRMYDFEAAGKPALKAPLGLNHAMRIDTRLTHPLSDLPPSTFGGNDNTPAMARNLAFRNLTRAHMVKLASGQQMVTFLKSKGVPVKALTRGQILNGSGGAVLDQLAPAERNEVATRTPLWFYVLREAELNNGRLTGVGGRIVAETFHRAMQGSTFSIVRDPDWKPVLGARKGTFEMTDLLQLAFGSTKPGLAPAG
jgi:hypothetical protein